MAKKKVIKKKSESRVVEKNVFKSSNSPWFRSSEGRNWGWIPLNWKGWVSFILLILVNVYAANYFNLYYAPWSDVGKFLIVFLLSLFVFISISIKKSEKRKK